MGVIEDRKGKSVKYQAAIKAYGKLRYLGRYDTPEEAHMAYMAAKKDAHKGWFEERLSVLKGE
jgi:hypothetical protein